MTNPHYGCYNRKPFKTEMQVVDGFRLSPASGPAWQVREAWVRTIPFVMSPNCEYTKTQLGQIDPRCGECKHKITTEENLDVVQR